MDKQNKIIVFWLITGAVLVFSMVMIGGITRLTHSGLSMVEWNLIMGVIPPMNDIEWKETFGKYQKFPEYNLINKEFSLEEFKSIFWWEYIHRIMGRLIGLVFFLPFMFFVIKKWLAPPLVKKLIIMFLLGGFQGFLGWYMVKSGLAENPYVSHYRLAIHLITATVLFGYIIWVTLGFFRIGDVARMEVPEKIKKLSLGLLALVLLQIIYGAFVAGLKAGFVFNTFPKMGEEWFPAAITTLVPFADNFIKGVAGVQFVHRYLAYMVAIFVLCIWLLARKQELDGIYQKGINAVFIVIIMQFALGVFTLIYSVPIFLAVLHQAMAMILLAAIVYWLSLLYPNKAQAFL